MAPLGVGIGWRPEIAEAIERLPGLDWVEVVAENLCPGHLPESLRRLIDRGVTVVPHGVSLGLGGADRPDPARLAALAERAVVLGAPLVTEHIAFVRAGGELTASPALEAGHLLPVPRTRDALAVLCENVRIAQDALPVPLALENIAALFSWPGEELSEGRFLAELVERTGVRLLIDVANLHTNRVNRGEDPLAVLDALPPEALAYVHVAGGVERDGVWHDTHAHPVPPQVLALLTALAARIPPAGVLLERDDAFPAEAELAAELEAVRTALAAAPAPAVAPTTPAAGTTGATGAGEGAEGARTAPGARVPAAVGAGPGGSSPAARVPAGATTLPAPPAAPAPPARPASAGSAVRAGVAVSQAALLSALVAGTPVPEGFDARRIRVQARALAAKRADVIAKVAPELPEILGAGYRDAFLDYATGHPMTGGYRRDALDFAAHLLLAGAPGDPAAHRALTHWWEDRSGPRPPGRVRRLKRRALAAVGRWAA
ncbi:DUF692 domain-containing protein [Streptomyces sp. NPDC097619]|uniref:DUF692 domain-containing protein n=1 Tax=Streptomyces sp. NPDC097619 TaxID=3157228 RepID=UPI00332430BE